MTELQPMLPSIAIVIVILIFIGKSLQVVPQQHAYVVERLGRFSRILEPGLRILIPFVDKMAIMEIIWYAAQFKAIGQGKKPNPKLSPLLVFLNYAKGNIKAVVKGRVNSRKSA